MRQTVILAVALFVAGCGGSGGTTTTPPPPPPPTGPTQIVSGPFDVGSAYSQPNLNTNSPLPWNIISNTFPVVADMMGGSLCGLPGEPPCISNYLVLTNLRNSSLRLDLPIDEIEVDANFDNVGSGSINLSLVVQLTADGNYNPNAGGAAFGVGQLPQRLMAKRTLADWAMPNLTSAQAATANFGVGLLTGFPDPSTELEVHAVQVTFYQHKNP